MDHKPKSEVPVLHAGKGGAAPSWSTTLPSKAWEEIVKRYFHESDKEFICSLIWKRRAKTLIEHYIGTTLFEERIAWTMILIFFKEGWNKEDTKKALVFFWSIFGSRVPARIGSLLFSKLREKPFRKKTITLYRGGRRVDRPSWTTSPHVAASFYKTWDDLAPEARIWRIDVDTERCLFKFPKGLPHSKEKEVILDVVSTDFSAAVDVTVLWKDRSVRF